MENNMSAGKVISVLLVVGAFAGGVYYGGSNSSPVITSSKGGASYSGGYDKSSEEAKQSSKSKSTVLKREVAGTTHTVNDGDSIMDAVQLAKPGDTIQIMPGNYHETVYIDKDDIHVIGVIKEGERATLDGKDLLNDAILYSGNNIIIENLLITRYKGNGIMGQAGNNFEIRNNIFYCKKNF